MKKPTERTPYVFVYGTLMSGMNNNYLLKKAQSIAEGTTKDNYKLYQRGIPFLVDEESSTYVYGEIYKIDEDDLIHLDSLEGHPEWYKRRVIDVVDDIGNKYEAWAYFMPKEKIGEAKIIEDGDYKTYVTELLMS